VRLVHIAIDAIDATLRAFAICEALVNWLEGVLAAFNEAHWIPRWLCMQG
jgi:hypothetical protein